MSTIFAFIRVLSALTAMAVPFLMTHCGAQAVFVAAAMVLFSGLLGPGEDKPRGNPPLGHGNPSSGFGQGLRALAPISEEGSNPNVPFIGMASFSPDQDGSGDLVGYDNFCRERQPGDVKVP